MSGIPDITDSELWVVKATLRERYGKPVEVELADVELRLDPAVPELTLCPAMVWKEQGAGFVISKVGDNRFRCQFFYSVREQYGTGKAEYDDLLECVVALLKLQADHAAQRQQNQ
jgi:hypothetical protein